MNIEQWDQFVRDQSIWSRDAINLGEKFFFHEFPGSRQHVNVNYHREIFPRIEHHDLAFVQEEREREYLHPAVTSVYMTSVTREQAPHGCGTQWCEFSKDVLQYARRRGGEEEEEEARSLIWINKGAIIRGAFGDSFTRHIFASRFNPSLQQLLPFPFCGNDAVHPWTIGREAPGAWINSRGSTSVHLVISLYEFQFFLSFFFFRFVLCIHQKELSLFRWKKWKKKKKVNDARVPFSSTILG